MMNECCQIRGNARIIESMKPGIAWRVVCSYCGLCLHEQGVNE
jgi:hypothetical protein